MQLGEGSLVEILHSSAGTVGRINCPPELVPVPGQYLLGGTGDLAGTLRAAPLPVTVFQAGPSPGGFLAAAPLPLDWRPGLHLHLRGPLGRGFELPGAARRVALFAWRGSPGCLLALLSAAFRQGAAVTLISDAAPADLPEEVEVQPEAALTDVLRWADYLALSAGRESLPGLQDRLRAEPQRLAGLEAQVLVQAPMPCGGAAECGVCAVSAGRTWKLVCRDGPVLPVAQLLG